MLVVQFHQQVEMPRQTQGLAGDVRRCDTEEFDAEVILG